MSYYYYTPVREVRPQYQDQPMKTTHPLDEFFDRPEFKPPQPWTFHWKVLTIFIELLLVIVYAPVLLLVILLEILRIANCYCGQKAGYDIPDYKPLLRDFGSDGDFICDLSPKHHK